MAGNVPGIVPSAALIGSRAVYKPFTLPQKFTDAGNNLGTAINGAVGGIASSLSAAYESLQPKGPAKWLSPLFGKVAEAAQQSEARGQKTSAVFWQPFSTGMEGVGRALAGPGTAYYLGKLGIENPTEDMIKGVLNMKLFKRPTADEVGGGAPPSEPPKGEPAPEPEPAPAPAPAPGPGDGPGDGGAPSGDTGGKPDGGDAGGGTPDGGTGGAPGGGTPGGDAGGGAAANGNGGINPAILEALKA